MFPLTESQVKKLLPSIEVDLGELGLRKGTITRVNKRITDAFKVMRTRFALNYKKELLKRSEKVEITPANIGNFEDWGKINKVVSYEKLCAIVAMEYNKIHNPKFTTETIAEILDLTALISLKVLTSNKSVIMPKIGSLTLNKHINHRMISNSDGATTLVRPKIKFRISKFAQSHLNSVVGEIVDFGEKGE